MNSVAPELRRHLIRIGNNVNITTNIGKNAINLLKEYRELMEKDGIFLDFFIVVPNNDDYMSLDYFLQHPSLFDGVETVNVFGVNFNNL